MFKYIKFTFKLEYFSDLFTKKNNVIAILGQ
jgi:hypothetical protein